MSAHGTVLALQYCPGHRKPMVAVLRAEALENLGLRNDMHALPDSTRQVLLLESETIAAFDLQPGELKENITTAGIPLMGLQRGRRLAVGGEVLLAVTKACSPCSRMDEIRPGLRGELAGKRGMLAQVVRGGTIACGDTIHLLGE